MNPSEDLEPTESFALDSSDSKAESQDCDHGRRAVTRSLILGALAITLGLSPETQGGPRKQDRDLIRPDYDDEEGELYTEEDLKEDLEKAAPEALMRPAEVENMQIAQEAIFRDYLDPGIIYALRGNPNEKDIFDKAMLLAAIYPHEFKYKKNEQDESIVMTKRSTSNAQVLPLASNGTADGANDELADLTIVIDKNGRVAKVNNLEIPYLPKDETDRFYADLYNPQWIKEMVDGLVRAIRRPFSQNVSAQKKLEEALQAPSPYRKMLYEINNIILPMRLKTLIEARNMISAGQIDNQGNWAYQNFVNAVNRNARSYDEMAANYPKKFRQVYVEMDPKKYPGVYMFHNSAGRAPLAVTREGYFLKVEVKGTDKKEFIPVMDRPESYKNALKKRYYRRYPEARGLVDL